MMFPLMSYSINNLKNQNQKQYYRLSAIPADDKLTPSYIRKPNKNTYTLLKFLIDGNDKVAIYLKN